MSYDVFRQVPRLVGHGEVPDIIIGHLRTPQHTPGHIGTVRGRLGQFVFLDCSDLNIWSPILQSEPYDKCDYDSFHFVFKCLFNTILCIK